MTIPKTERRLAAILAADVVGYSKMMGTDEAGTLEALRTIWHDHFNPCIAEHNGRIVKMMGDGALAEFASVLDAVSCAIHFQKTMAARNSGPGHPIPVVFRIGVNLGDIVIEDGDIFGDGVNIAARLESQAPSGGVLTSGSVNSLVADRIDETFRDLGRLQLKNIDRKVHCWAWYGDDGDDGTETGKTDQPAELSQEIHFCTSRDGTDIAYAISGSGPPLVRAPHWMSHLEFDLKNPIWRHFLQELSSEHTLVRFDQRGNGLSSWEAEDISFEAFVDDLEAVIDAAGLERFPLLGISQGCPISIAYAARHPEKISHLILYGGFARGRNRRGLKSTEEETAAIGTLMRLGWGKDNPAFRQIFSSSFIPGATSEQWGWFNELQKISVSPENAVRIFDAINEIDVEDLLGQINIPTLVLHCRNDSVHPYSESRRIASGIPGAKLVILEGKNHMILENEPAWPLFVKEIRNFLKST